MEVHLEVDLEPRNFRSRPVGILLIQGKIVNELIEFHVFPMQGLMTSVIGVTLLDLGEIYDAPIRDASHIITFRGCGALMGSLFGGMLLDR